VDDLENVDRGLIKLLGFVFDETGPDRVVLSWTTGPEHLQPYGIVHGGVYCAAAETAASIAAGLWYGERGRVVGVANHTNFLRATREGEHVVATATPVHRGRSQQLWQIEMRDDDGRLVARGEVRLQNLTG
jgi:1,4-dihydroxy-2-naphthoyl-CoA hydrolase